MGFFDLFKQPDFSQGIKDYQNAQGAVLLDVRTPQEFKSGHIPQSKNIPLQTIEKVSSVVKNKDTALYVYCQSGARSRQAASALKGMGYTNVKNIGGIAAYTGRVVK
ncbi:MAG: rhodanese-like domain-containing protein [Firmicutes bacterium]|nr:rhodanese-like domain-containing protein [Bacillota bacterium]